MLAAILRALTGAAAGGTGFRARGAAWFLALTGRGATTARMLAWALPMMLQVAWETSLGLHWAAYPLVFVAAWAGCVLGWWGSLDMGRRDGSWLIDCLLHTLRGSLFTLPVGIVLLNPWVAASGLLCGLVYELGYQASERLKLPVGGSEIGEAAFGVIVFLAVSIAVGEPNGTTPGDIITWLISRP